MIKAIKAARPPMTEPAMMPALAPEERDEELDDELAAPEEGSPEETIVEAGRAEVMVEVPITMTDSGWEEMPC